MSATKQFSLTDEEAPPSSRRYECGSDLHHLADKFDASDDPGDLRKQAVDLSILHDKLAAGSS